MYSVGVKIAPNEMAVILNTVECHSRFMSFRKCPQALVALCLGFLTLLWRKLLSSRSSEPAQTDKINLAVDAYRGQASDTFRHLLPVTSIFQSLSERWGVE